MKCLNTDCGAELLAVAKFCDNCGTQVLNELPCVHCQTLNPPTSKFCMECGKPPTEKAAAGVTRTEKILQATDGEFLFELTEDELKRRLSKEASIPYGCVAVTMVDGHVVSVRRQQTHDKINSTNLDATNPIQRFKSFLKSAWTFMTGVGGPAEKTRTFIMMDAEDLPMLSYAHPTPMPGNMDSSLKFNFWVRAVEYERRREEAGEYQGDGEDSPQNVARALEYFFARVVRSGSRLSIGELKQVATTEIVRIIESSTLSVLAKDPTGPSQIMATMRRSLGIDGRCIFVRSKNNSRQQFEVSRSQGTVLCSCGAEINRNERFCKECGTSTSAVLVASTNILQAMGGEELVLLVNMLANDSDEKFKLVPEKVTAEIIKYLSPYIRRMDVDSLMKAGVLRELSDQLNQHLLKDWWGYVTEFQVVDIKLAAEDWLFKTDALVKEELRKIKSQEEFLGIDRAEVDLGKMAYDLVLRKIRQDDDQDFALRQQALQARTNVSGVEIQEHDLETKIDLKKEEIELEAEKTRFEREKERSRREREAERQDLRSDKEFNREQLTGDRSDDREQLSHEMGLEKETAKHDIDLADLTLQAESRKKRRDVDDDVFERESGIKLRTEESEQAIRLRVVEREKLGNIEEDLKDREARRKLEEERQELEHSRFAIQQQAQLEIAKREAMRGLDSAQMLAMQAAELAKAGGSAEAAATIVKSIAESQSQAAGAGIKDDMYKQMLELQRESGENKDQMFKQMLEIQRQSAEMAVGAHREAAGIAQSTNEKSMANMMQVAIGATQQSNEGYKEAAKIAQSTNEKSMASMAQVATKAADGSGDGYKDAAKIAQSVNEKSMESMAKVTVAAVGGKGAIQKDADEDTAKQIPCTNSGCNSKLGPNQKYCAACGTPRKQ